MEEQGTKELLSMKSPCLWDLVWSSTACFIPNLRVSIDWANCAPVHGTGYQFRRFAGSYSDKALDSSQGAGNANPKTGGQAPLRTNYEGEKTNFGPLFYSCVLFSCSLLIFSPKPGPSSPSLGFFKDNSICPAFFWGIYSRCYSALWVPLFGNLMEHSNLIQISFCFELAIRGRVIRLWAFYIVDPLAGRRTTLRSGGIQ